MVGWPPIDGGDSNKLRLKKGACCGDEGGKVPGGDRRKWDWARARGFLEKLG